MTCASTYSGALPPSPSRRIFVFGSNLAGRHGKGAALWARRNFGAIYGRGIGIQGDSYAIPTKDENLRTLPLSTIQGYVNLFLDFARNNPGFTFWVTPIGCGLAGYKPHQINPLFTNVPPNCILPEGWSYNITTADPPASPSTP